MKIEGRVTSWLLAVLTGVAVCLPPASWVLSAFGLPCRSLISDEGVRWLFHHMPTLTATPLTACALSYAMAIGCLQQCIGLHRRLLSRIAPMAASLGTALLLATLLVLSAFMPQSPLLGITGGLWPSPLMHGFPVFLALSLMLVAFVYHIVAGQMTSVQAFATFITWGIRRYCALIAAAMLLSFISGTLHYIL